MCGTARIVTFWLPGSTPWGARGADPSATRLPVNKRAGCHPRRKAAGQYVARRPPASVRPWSGRRAGGWDSLPGNVLLPAKATGLPKDSVAVVSQIVTLDRGVLSARVGRLAEARLDDVLAGILLLVVH